MSNYLKLSQDLMSSELSRILVITYDWAMLNLNWPCRLIRLVLFLVTF